MENEFKQKKCCFISFTRKPKPHLLNYHLGHHFLDRVNNFKYLGIYFSSDLTRNKHIDYVTNKASGVLNFIKRNFKTAPVSLKEALYTTNVRPILEYACAIWDPHFHNLIYKVERIQNRAARFVTSNYDFRLSITNLKSLLNWSLLRQRRKFLRLKLFYAIYNDRTGIDKSMYMQAPNHVSRRTDHQMKVREINCRTDVFGHSFFPPYYFRVKSSGQLNCQFSWKHVLLSFTKLLFLIGIWNFYVILGLLVISLVCHVFSFM